MFIDVKKKKKRADGNLIKAMRNNLNVYNVIKISPNENNRLLKASPAVL